MAPRYYDMSTNVKPKPVRLLVCKQLKDWGLSVPVVSGPAMSLEGLETARPTEVERLCADSVPRRNLTLLEVKRTAGVDAGPLRCRYYGGGISAHTATRGLFTGIGLRHVAARSVGMIAAFRFGPQ